MKLNRLLFLAAHFLMFNCFSQENAKLTRHYGQKYYLSERDIKKTTKLYRFPVFRKGEVIADIGAFNGSIDFAIASQNPGLTFYLQDCQADRLNKTGFYEMNEHFTKVNGKPIEATFNFVIGSNTKTNLPDSTFDKVILTNTFEYISKCDLYLKDLRAKLKKDGKVFLVTDNPFTDSYFIRIFEANGFTCEENKSAGGWIRLLFNTKQKPALVGDIFDAVVQKDFLRTKAFLDQGVSANSKLNKATLLLLACSVSDNREIIQLLLDRGALVNGATYDLFCFIPLSKLCGSGDYGTAEVLLKNGADPNLQDPLWAAVWFGHNIELVKLLVEKGALICGNGNKPGNVLRAMALGGDLEIIRYIFSRPDIKDIHSKNESGQSFIHWAARGYNSRVMGYLLEEKGFELHEKDKEGMTVLMHAVYGGSIEMVKYLVGEKKMQVNEKNKDGFTALHYALDSQIKNYLTAQGAKE